LYLLCSSGSEEPNSIFAFSHVYYHRYPLYKLFACPRYTPAMMFFIEGISKLFTLLLVSVVAIEIYGAVEAPREFTGSSMEYGLFIMTVTLILFEIGQLATCNWSLNEYFGGVWNILDVFSCSMLLVWCVCLPFPDYFQVGLASLAAASVPLAVLQLQYLSLIKTLGLLVLMIQSMMVDVATFIVVYVVSIYGFTVCFRALFFRTKNYGNTGTTFVTLFQSTLGQFEFGDFEHSEFELFGILVMIVFMTLTNVLLINLLIAQMASTYNRISLKSREEWTFVKVRKYSFIGKNYF
jgi:hypothetical protein